MLSKVLSKFSGGQLTAIILAAICVPGAVTAAVTFQPVAIVDPVTGKQSFVDGARRLWVYDPIAGYRNNPANLVEIAVSNNTLGCETANQYTVPSGKALILTSISGEVRQSGTAFSGYYVFDGPSCSGTALTTFHTTLGADGARAPVAVDLGVGVPVKAGKTVSVSSSNNFGFTFLHGYLVPAGAVPAALSAEAKLEPMGVTAADVAAKMKRR